MKVYVSLEETLTLLYRQLVMGFWLGTTQIVLSFLEMEVPLKWNNRPLEAVE